MIEITLFIHHSFLPLRVIPHAGRNELKEENGKLKVYLKAPAQDNKANEELLKFLKKEYKLSFRLKSGHKSREKVLELIS